MGVCLEHGLKVRWVGVIVVYLLLEVWGGGNSFGGFLE